VDRLRTEGFGVHDQDVARLSPFVRHHVNMLGRYSFQLPEMPGGLRPLRDADVGGERQGLRPGRIRDVRHKARTPGTHGFVPSAHRSREPQGSDWLRWPDSRRHGG